MRGDHLIRQRRDGLSVRKVNRVARNPDLRRYAPTRRFEPRFIAIGEGQMRPRAGKLNGQFGANAAGRAGQDNNAIPQIEIHSAHP
jgi:hypothetical protein